MKKNALMLSLFMISIMLSSCSVIMASKKEGVSVERVQAARTRGQMIACGVHVISSERMVNGDLVEVYQIQKERGSAARALMHGTLDVVSCGLWEVVGTPIEATVDQAQFYTIRVFYNDQEMIQKVELM